MPSWSDRLFANLALAQASATSRAFERACGNVDDAQRAALRRALGVVAGSAFARAHDLTPAMSARDFRRAVPIRTFEQMRPWVERVAAGDTSALFAAGREVLMFATSSGTTAKPKWIPVTREFVADYRRGWRTFGLKMLLDHPKAILRHILQSSGKHDADHTACGVPVGAITGLLARMQSRIVKRYYVGHPSIAAIESVVDRQYALMRLAIARDVAFAITANPATLVQLAKAVDSNADHLIRDLHDGSLRSPTTGQPLAISKQLILASDRARARELESLRSRNAGLRPSDYWQMNFLACWTGASMAHYLDAVREWYGPIPIRDIGLLASEGRVTIPLDDNTPVGVLDVHSAFYEFLPADRFDDPNARTLTPRELQVGEAYTVLLTNTSGLCRYRLDDVVIVRGWRGQAPLLEFSHRAGRVSSVAGEKLTESQVVAAAMDTFAKLALRPIEFLVAPVWSDPPAYRITVDQTVPEDFTAAFDVALGQQNDEYESRRKSFRLGSLTIRVVPRERLASMHTRLMAARTSTAEQYKRPVLFTGVGDDDRALDWADGAL